MIKHLAIILLSSVFVMETVFPQADLADISRLSEVLKHFEKHHLESPGITFLEFLSLHYGSSDHLDQQNQDHEKLPFSKRLHHQVQSLQFVPNIERLHPSRSCTLLMVISEVLYRRVGAPSVAISIWQPPRI